MCGLDEFLKMLISNFGVQKCLRSLRSKHSVAEGVTPFYQN